MGVVRSDLVIPFQIAVFRVQGQDTIRIKIIAGPVTIVGVGIRITGGPVERISFLIVRTRQPGRSPARFWRIATPGLSSWFALSGNSPAAPEAFQIGSPVCGDESADAPIAA